VRWPEDQPSRGCAVIARRHVEDEIARRSEPVSSTAPVRSDGTFEMSGLGSAPVDLTVDLDYQVQTPDPADAESGAEPRADSGADRSTRRNGAPRRGARRGSDATVTWVRLSARADAVVPGSTNVLLQLRPITDNRPAPVR
jgi:hypothetical protein